MEKRLIAASLASLALLAGCAVPEQTFLIRAYNTQETEVRCRVIVDNEPYQVEGRELMLTPHEVKLKFKKTPDGQGYQSINVEVRAVELNEQGKPVLDRGKEVSSYMPDSRDLEYGDARNQVFFLKRKPSGS